MIEENILECPPLVKGALTVLTDCQKLLTLFSKHKDKNTNVHRPKPYIDINSFLYYGVYVAQVNLCKTNMYMQRHYSTIPVLEGATNL